MACNKVEPPSEEAMTDILEARRQILGHSIGNNMRSGRKALRSNLKGKVLKAWYPVNMRELGLEKIGIENPEVEQRYRRDQELKRIGKTLIKGKVRGPTERFLTRIALEDNEEHIIDPLDYYDPEDVVPAPHKLEQMMQGMDAEEREMLREVFLQMALDLQSSGQQTPPEASAGAQDAATKETKAEKQARARKVDMRTNQDDKRASMRRRVDEEDGSEEEDDTGGAGDLWDRAWDSDEEGEGDGATAAPAGAAAAGGAGTDAAPAAEGGAGADAAEGGAAAPAAAEPAAEVELSEEDKALLKELEDLVAALPPELQGGGAKA